MPVLPGILPPDSDVPASGAATLRVTVGTPGFEVIAPVRAMVQDSTGLRITDDVLRSYAQEVADDVSRHVPLEYIVGDPYAMTSPLNTVAGQQRYALQSGTGFTHPVLQVTDVLYRAGGGAANVSEYNYMQLMGVSPIGRFIASPYAFDSPTYRHLLNLYANEASKWGVGHWTIARTPTGLALDLLPPADANGLPVYVRYTAPHELVDNVDGSVSIPTIPYGNRRDFFRLLWAMVLEQEGERLSLTGDYKAGLIQRKVDAKELEERIVRLREEAYASLGAYAGTALVSS